MPKLVREIASGSENSRSLENSQTADVSVRTFRVILDSASEAYDVQEAVGVYIGDVHPVNSNLPCVSISEKAEGDSRVVRIVTVNYRTSPGADPGSDPNKQPPDIRPAQFAISSSLMEVPATRWRRVGLQADPAAVAALPEELRLALQGGFCWVAREVYGPRSVKWVLFRDWLMTDSPQWLFDAYKNHGQRFALWIKDKPLIKWIVRVAMDVAISSRNAGGR
jgi:hypothetical protein